MTSSLPRFTAAAAAACVLAVASTAGAQSIDREALVTITDRENGDLRSEVLLPCGQAYVELFQRRSGVQVTALDITSSERAVSGGYCTYSAVTTGFSPGQPVETRFYSYLPGAPGVFTPGPGETTWRTYAYGRNPIGARPGNVQPGDLHVVDLGDGQARFDLYAPSGQHYAEVFARRDGVQDVAGDVTGTETPLGGGMSRYERVHDAYADGAAIEYRAYHFLPSTAGVFAPGPSPGAWKSYTYGDIAGVMFDRWQLAPGPDLDVDVYYGHATSHIVPAHTGWYLNRAAVPPLTVPTNGFATTRVAEVYVRRCDTAAWERLSELPAYDYPSATDATEDGLYQFAPTPTWSVLPGTRVNPQYECGGHKITIPTFIGPQTLTTGAKIHYAYVVVRVNDWHGH